MKTFILGIILGLLLTFLTIVFKVDSKFISILCGTIGMLISVVITRE
jgi:hypothetical protein